METLIPLEFDRHTSAGDLKPGDVIWMNGVRRKLTAIEKCLTRDRGVVLRLCYMINNVEYVHEYIGPDAIMMVASPSVRIVRVYETE